MDLDLVWIIWMLALHNAHGSFLLMHSDPLNKKPLGNSASALDGKKIPMQVLPPNLPERFYTEFEIIYTPRDDPGMPLPPWPAGHPPALPYAIGRGKTWYAADLGIAIEWYTDYCVPIFEPNSYFPCVLFNYNGTAYFISPKYTGYGPCCVYRRHWTPPHRDFMQQYARYYNGSTTKFGDGVLEQTVDWWIIPQPEDAGKKRGSDHPVFGGYGWAREALPSGHRAQVCFWYEGNVGWTQQLFYNFVDSGPRTKDVEKFQLPDVCLTNRACLYRP
ncbi:hypothetical protein T265_05974 [Opisthorchis viverrini]|uniref:AMOP domain protein n=1 Tax=Opisthorchis viverrini TaxID=6198 RepID=A0A075AEL5_OPIVI|nr:hypothetical protein T265_05974 [Opisthorchis viverrini]KER26839.1 hypothetical protein T265_05974 [Opisthorchis viverrini]